MSRTAAWTRHPSAVAILAMIVYAALLSPAWIAAGYDFSVFVIAGDRFVSAADLPSPLIVRPASDGYDGQFYYRIALDPFDFSRTAYGVTLDGIAWRLQRIGYPLLAWIVSFGRPEALPAILVVLNLAGLGVIAAIIARLIAEGRLPAWTLGAILIWPGFIVTLTHDTTEIVALAFLLAAIACHLDRRTFWCGALAAAAMLTRETTAAVCFGLLLGEIARSRPSWSRAVQLAPYLAAFAPFLLWRAALAVWAGETSGAVGASNLDWPLVGALKMMVQVATGAGSWGPTPLKDAAMRAFVLAGAASLLAFCVFVATRLPPLLRDPDRRGLAFGWIAMASVMALMSADGPWIDSTAYFRAFTETFALGCLILGLRREPITAAVAVIPLAVGLFAGAWGLTLIQLRV